MDKKETLSGNPFYGDTKSELNEVDFEGDVPPIAINPMVKPRRRGGVPHIFSSTLQEIYESAEPEQSNVDAGNVEVEEYDVLFDNGERTTSVSGIKAPKRKPVPVQMSFFD